MVEPPDTYFATQVLGVPIGHCRDGFRRTAANVAAFPQFHGVNNAKFNDHPLDFPDTWAGDPRLKFATDPHAMTVAYDVEAMWVVDDRDSVWSDMGKDARATFPRMGSMPGINDEFTQNPGTNGFAAFNDFTADYWFVTGVPVPARAGGTASIPAGLLIPPEMNSGVTGTQISINGQVGQTILVRVLPASFNSVKVTFPVDVVIIAWDGRALGQPPFGHNDAYLVPAGTPIDTGTARRFDALMRFTAPFSGNGKVEFINTRGQNVAGFNEVVMTALIPINIGPGPIPPPNAIVINGGAPVTNKLSATLTLTAPGATQMQFSKDGVFFFPFETFAATRVVTLLPGDGLKTITVRFKDAAGVVSTPVAASITLNTTAPTGTILINNGAIATNKLSVTLTLTAADVGGINNGTIIAPGIAGVTEMQFRKDGGNFFPFEPFATTRVVTLPPGDGLKTITVRFRDVAGNISAPLADSIILDTTLPTGTIAFATPTTTAANATLTLTATDPAGVTQMQFSKNGSGFFALEPFANSRTVSLAMGLNTLAVRFKDAAGNLSAPITATITRTL